jgi:DNA topoisomerase I
MTNNWENLKEGDILDLREVILYQKFTTPPPRYSQASLIKKLEELGIGRPSTYATIISTLQDRNYVEDKKNQMKPTVLGRQVNKLLKENFTSVTSSELTAEIEDKLDEISRNENTYFNVVSLFWQSFLKQIQESEENINSKKIEYKTTETSEICPICQNKMTIKIGRFGQYFQCSHEQSHQFALNYKEYEIELEKAREAYKDLTIGKKCEECQKDLIVRVSKSSLKPYIACPEYKVGNKHTVLSINKIMNPDEKNTKFKPKFKKNFKRK